MTSNHINPFFFWQSSSPFSNWHPSKFRDDSGNIFYNSEQYMMYKKALLFNDNLIAEEIIKCKSPKECKALGRKVKNFDSETWEAVSQEVVYQGCLYKFQQNKVLKSYLMKSGNRLIVEASPYDKYWGIGLNSYEARRIPMEEWPGKNWLGIVLMRVRDTLAE